MISAKHIYEGRIYRLVKDDIGKEPCGCNACAFQKEKECNNTGTKCMIRNAHWEKTKDIDVSNLKIDTFDISSLKIKHL
jgi:hypothetical protein